MQKSLRSLVFVAVVSLTAAPALHAGVMGTDPRPTGHAVKSPSVAHTILSFFGLEVL